MWWGWITKSILKIIDRASLIAGIILAVMMFLIIADVIMRYAFSRPISGVLEITEEILMIMIVFLALASAPHIRVSFISERLRPRMRGILRMITLVPAIVFLVILDVRSFLNATFSYEKGENSLAMVIFPLYPSRFLIFIGFTLFTLKLLLSFVRIAQGKEED